MEKDIISKDFVHECSLTYSLFNINRAKLFEDLEKLEEKRLFLEEDISNYKIHESRHELYNKKKINDLEETLNQTLYLIELDKTIISYTLSYKSSEKKEKKISKTFFESFKNYFTFSNFLNKSIELTFGSTITAIILLFVNPLKKFARRIFDYIVSKFNSIRESLLKRS